MKLFGNRQRKQKTTVHMEAAKESTQKTSFWKSIGRGKRALMIVLAILLLIIAALIVAKTLLIKPPEVLTPHMSLTAIDPDTGEVAQQTQVPETQKKGFYNILIAGTDHDGTRTDTIMVARLDAAKHTVAIMSIPRDTLIETKKGMNKINSVYGTYGCGQKGMEALMLEVEDIIGFMPSGYVLVDLNAFVELVDLIGGVQFNVPQRMYYSDPTQNLYIDLYPGMQRLDGEHAMQLVRFRSYAAADIQRTKVQQDFLRELAKQCLTISNIGNIKGYIEIFNKNVLTNFTTGNLLYFAQELVKCDFNQMQTYTLPGEPVMIASCGSSYKLHEDQVKKIVDESFNPYANANQPVQEQKGENR